MQELGYNPRKPPTNTIARQTIKSIILNILFACASVIKVSITTLNKKYTRHATSKRTRILFVLKVI